MLNKLNTKYLFFALRITGIIVFIMVLFRLDIQEVWKQMLKVETSMFLIALFLQAVLLSLKGIRWHLLNVNRDAKLIQSLGEFLESYAIGIITPGRLGELMKVGYQKDIASKVNAGIRVLVERGLDFGFFIIIGGISLGWGNMVVSNLNLGLIIIFTGIASILFSAILASSPKLFLFFTRYSKRLVIPQRFVSNKVTIIVLLISFSSNLVYFLSCYLLAYGLTLPISFITVSGGASISGLLNTIPLTIMGLGTREVTFLYVFKQFDVSLVMALSGLVFLVAQIGGGLIALISGHICLFVSSKIK